MTVSSDREFLGWSWPRIEGSRVSHTIVEVRPGMAGPACGSHNASGQLTEEGIPDGYEPCRRAACIAATRRAALGRLATIAQRLRDTADGLRSGTIHPVHAANRLDKIAGEIAGSKVSRKGSRKG